MEKKTHNPRGWTVKWRDLGRGSPGRKCIIYSIYNARRRSHFIMSVVILCVIINVLPTFYQLIFPSLPTFLQNDNIAPPRVCGRITFIYLHARASVYTYKCPNKNELYTSEQWTIHTRTHAHKHTHIHTLYIIYDLLESYVMFIVRGSHTLVLQCDYKTHFFEYFFFLLDP